MPVVGMEPKAVATVGALVTGHRVERVERLAGSVGNHNYALSTRVGDFVLKASLKQDLAAEAWACQRVHREGVLVPEIIWLEAEAQSLPMPFLVMRRLPGDALAGPSPVLVAAGRQLALVHSIRLEGYGALAVEGSNAVGTIGTWAAFVVELTAGLEDLVTGRILAAPFADAASAALEQSTDALSFDSPAVLLHGDLKLAHIFANSGRYQGLIDWGDICAGDPRLDLGRMSMAGPAAFATFMSGYGLAVTPELGRALAGYRLVWNIAALTYEYRADGDWFDTFRSGIAAAVHDLASVAVRSASESPIRRPSVLN